MNLALQFSSTFLMAFVAGIGITAIVRYCALSANVVDVPDAKRKIHTQPTPLWGGCALYVTMSVTMSAVAVAGWLIDDRISIQLIIGLIIAGAILVVGGMLDDKFSLAWWKQFLFPVCAVIVMLIAGLKISYVSNPFGQGFLYLDQWKMVLGSLSDTMYVIMPIADIFLFLWILGMIYTTKLLDGIDGLTSSVSGIAAIVIFVVSLSWDMTGSTTSFLAIALTGTVFGFLIWNWYPAKIFLGEGGSTFLGFMLAVLAVISGGKIATALLVMGIPILDVVWIVGRRLLTRKKIFIGDAQHLHFRLLHIGLSQRQIVFVLSFLSLLFGSVSFFFTTKVKILALTALIVVMIILATIVVRYEKKNLDSAA